MRQLSIIAVVMMLIVTFKFSTVQAAPKSGTYTTAESAGRDYEVQGEYAGKADDDKIGFQVIALGDGKFQAVYYPGGLPGDGWSGKHKSLCQGVIDGKRVMFKPAAGDRKYMAGNPDQFSATEKFPPEGHREMSFSIEASRLTGKFDDGTRIEATKVQRKSPTLGANAPKGAVVLMPYEAGKKTSLDAWTNDKWTLLDTGAAQVAQKSGSNNTKQQFAGKWKLHIEFRSPFQPKARSQGRGNSGVFPPGGREIQVLDSFGLEGKPNECGGIYKDHPPAVNMCYPPLTWQTYDVTYDPGTPTQLGKQAVPASYHIVHNGVVIHEKLELGKPRKGGLSMQDHGNPVEYRNIWMVLIDE